VLPGSSARSRHSGAPMVPPERAVGNLAANAWSSCGFLLGAVPRHRQRAYGSDNADRNKLVPSHSSARRPAGACSTSPEPSGSLVTRRTTGVRARRGVRCALVATGRFGPTSCRPRARRLLQRPCDTEPSSRSSVLIVESAPRPAVILARGTDRLPRPPTPVPVRERDRLGRTGRRRHGPGGSPARGLLRRALPRATTLPGVLMVESLAQLGGIAVLADERYANKLPLFGGIDRARFRRQVVPGEVLELEVNVGRLSARAGTGMGAPMSTGRRRARSTSSS